MFTAPTTHSDSKFFMLEAAATPSHTTEFSSIDLMKEAPFGFILVLKGGIYRLHYNPNCAWVTPEITKLLFNNGLKWCYLKMWFQWTSCFKKKFILYQFLLTFIPSKSFAKSFLKCIQIFHELEVVLEISSLMREEKTLSSINNSRDSNSLSQISSMKYQMFKKTKASSCSYGVYNAWLKCDKANISVNAQNIFKTKMQTLSFSTTSDWWTSKPRVLKALTVSFLVTF